jgi:hypothetical protein
MDAPVYRHAESRATLLGLNFPTDFFVVVVLSYLWLLLLAPAPSVLAAIGTHLGMALLNHGRPPQYWPHWLAFHVRRRLYRGHLSAAARSRAPQFSHGPYRTTGSAEGLS